MPTSGDGFTNWLHTKIFFSNKERNYKSINSLSMTQPGQTTHCTKTDVFC